MAASQGLVGSGCWTVFEAAPVGGVGEGVEEVVPGAAEAFPDMLIGFLVTFHFEKIT